MTDKTKRTFDVWTNLTKIINPALLLTILVMVFNGGKILNDIKTKTFDTVDDKINTKNLVRDSFTAQERYIIMDYVKRQESNYNFNTKGFVKKDDFDSIMKLNAVTIFQIKESVKEIETTVKKLER